MIATEYARQAVLDERASYATNPPACVRFAVTATPERLREMLIEIKAALDGCEDMRAYKIVSEALKEATAEPNIESLLSSFES